MYSEQLAHDPIVVIDKFLHPNTFLAVNRELPTLRPWKREVDFHGAKPVGETCDLTCSSGMYRSVCEELEKLFSTPWQVDRFYVNRFSPQDVPQFHADGDVLTCVFYADAQDWQPWDHGETQILIHGEIRGILPLPNRMLVFDGRLLHRATPFQNRPRHTVAAKLEGVAMANVLLP